MVKAIGRAMRPTDFVLPPLPNQLFTRDTSAWIYGGVSLNHMYWPARQHESLNVEAVYRFHPRFREADFQIWFGGVDHDWGTASIEGGDIMPVGDGVLLVGQGERSTAKAVSILAQNLFAAGAARLVIGALMPRERAAMHLDTVFTFCDRDLVTIYEPVVSADPADHVPPGRQRRRHRASCRSARSSTRCAESSGWPGDNPRLQGFAVDAADPDVGEGVDGPVLVDRRASRRRVRPSWCARSSGSAR